MGRVMNQNNTSTCQSIYYMLNKTEEKAWVQLELIKPRVWLHLLCSHLLVAIIQTTPYGPFGIDYLI